jgi:hypothetical protein
MIDDTGVLSLSHNWFKPNWVISHGSATGTVNNDGTSVLGTSPGFADEGTQDYHLLSNSACVNAGTNLNAEVLPLNNILSQYVKHQQGQMRPSSGALDLGAYEFAGVAPVQIMTGNLQNGRRGRFYHQTLQATGGSGSFVWSVTAGNLPNGLWLDPATGQIYGKTGLKGVWNFTVKAEDAQNAGVFATKNLTIRVNLFADF